ncbi:unnamed protein product [Dovyalis caffra]|uniref:Uncharacterized protein n=1 Tax=Dovyalis caffra TaxID=77055 RepID=A0AAV1RHW9_9ROSI|nr:unnamed protein product [Dovyalis caffra]
MKGIRECPWQFSLKKERTVVIDAPNLVLLKYKVAFQEIELKDVPHLLEIRFNGYFHPGEIYYDRVKNLMEKFAHSKLPEIQHQPDTSPSSLIVEGLIIVHPNSHPTHLTIAQGRLHHPMSVATKITSLHDVKFIQDIVKKVGEKLKMEMLYVPSYLVRIDYHVNDIKTGYKIDPKMLDDEIMELEWLDRSLVRQNEATGSVDRTGPKLEKSNNKWVARRNNSVGGELGWPTALGGQNLMQAARLGGDRRR